MKLKIAFFLISGTLFSLCSFTYGAQRFSIDLNYPSFSGDFYVSGTVSFPPGAARSEQNIIVKVGDTGQETPTFIRILQKWADGSLLNAEVMFVANSSRRKEYFLLYGDEVKRRKIFSKTAVLPTVSFSIAGLPKTSEKMDLEVGRINVTVDKSPNIRYYGYAIPIAVVILLTYIRFLKTRKPYED